MNLMFCIWLLLVVIGVSDAKTHRIPNSLLMLLAAFICISILVGSVPGTTLATFLNSALAFVITFTAGLILYISKVLAPGDVKLIAVLGLFLGTNNLTSFTLYVCLATTFVGPMYWLMNRLYLAPKKRCDGERAELLSLTGITIAIQLGKQELDAKVMSGQGLTYMPFAPILVIGLALQQYYG